MKNLIFSKLNLLAVLTFYFLLHLSFNVTAQVLVPSFCNESPGARWATYMDWIKPSAPVSNGLVFSLQKYSLASISLNATAILTNTHNLLATGNVSFILSDRVGNSCLKERKLSLKNPNTCTSQIVNISGQFGVGGNPLPTPGFITLNGESYKYLTSSGDIHSFKKEAVNEILVIHIKKTQVN